MPLDYIHYDLRLASVPVPEQCGGEGILCWVVLLQNFNFSVTVQLIRSSSNPGTQKSPMSSAKSHVKVSLQLYGTY